MAKPPTKKQQRAAQKVLDAHWEADRMMMADERDRQAHELRHRAHPLSAAGNQEAAHELLREAANLYTDDDPSAGAAACWYDLAESFKRLDPTRSRENLLEAERLLRRCLASPARKRDPIRLARTHDSLGQVLRRIALLIDDEQTRFDYEDRSITEHQRAYELFEGLPGLDLTVGASYRLNLGNALGRRERWREAIRHYQRAVTELERGALEYPALMELIACDEPPLPAARLQFAELLARASETDEHVDRILALVGQALTSATPPMRARAYHLVFMVLSRFRPEATAQIDKAIRAIDPTLLHPDQFAIHVDQLIAFGRLDVALDGARKGRDLAMHVRANSLADHVADAAAERAQRFALYEARVHLASTHPVDAFLALENFAALRYYDHVREWALSHHEPVARALAERCRELSRMAVEQDEFAAHLAHVPPEVQREVIERFRTQLEANINAQRELPEHVAAAAEWRLSCVRVAQDHPSPVAFLRGQAERMLVEIRRLNEAASARDPEHARERIPCDVPVSPTELRELLREQPDRVMLRLHWSNELFAAAVWLEHDEVVGNAARLPLRVDSLAPSLNLAHFDSSQAKQAEYSGPSMAEILAGLDLDSVLPPPSQSRKAELLLLPSTYASLIPWAAAGPPGATLLDRFEAITWLHNLTPLRVRQVFWRARSGTVVVCPGKALEHPTEMHSIAFAHRRPGEIRLFDRQANLRTVRARVRDADIVAFYTHGSYTRDEPGHLCLADGNLEVDELGRDFVGCERVELWACRSGVNRSTHILTPFFVDEAFGMDIAFHHHGVRSTIGTLWTVADAVTAKLVERYRGELDAGLQAPAALACAQRWWRDEALPKIRQELDSQPLKHAWRSIVTLLDLHSEEEPLETLGRTLSQHSHSPESVWAALSPPEAWAGYRFVGVCERRPLGEPLPELAELTPEQRREFEAIIAGARALG
jgi:tetratricopeptide (TPR) repeat protein